VKGLARVLGVVLGGYLIVRGVAEPFVVDMSDAASYRDDWGGPNLVGVLAVHVVPGVVAAVLMGAALRRRLRARAVSQAA
jgi:hypothetical protein